MDIMVDKSDETRRLTLTSIVLPSAADQAHTSSSRHFEMETPFLATMPCNPKFELKEEDGGLDAVEQSRCDVFDYSAFSLNIPFMYRENDLVRTSV